MDILTDRGSPTASPRGGNGCNGAAAPPPPTEPSAQGGGAMDFSAQGVAIETGSRVQGVVVPPRGSGVIDGERRKSGEEEEKAKEGGNGGGEVVATPLDDLNIKWTTSTLGSSEEMVKGPPVGEGGGAMVVGDGGEKVPATHLVEPSDQSVTTREGRDVVVPTEQVVIAEEAESSEEESGGVSGERWRVRPRGGEDVVITEWGIRGAVGASGSGGVGSSGSSIGGSGDGGEGSGTGGSGDDPKGKRIATEEPVREQGPMGISLGDYAVHADPKDVAALGREAPRVLDAVREEVVGGREREIVVLRQAALEAEAKTEEWIREAEEEEAELEQRAWEESEVAQGPRVSVVQEAAAALAGRPHFDEATYDPPVHLFIPSGIDAYVSRQETYFGE